MLVLTLCLALECLPIRDASIVARTVAVTTPAGARITFALPATYVPSTSLLFVHVAPLLSDGFE